MTLCQSHYCYPIPTIHVKIEKIFNLKQQYQRSRKLASTAGVNKLMMIPLVKTVKIIRPTKKDVLLTPSDYTLLYKINTRQDVNAFRDFMNEIIQEDAIEQRIHENNLQISVEEVRRELLNRIATCYCNGFYDVSGHQSSITNILIKEYNFVPDDEFMRENIPGILNIDMLVFYHNHVDLKRYIPEIGLMFRRVCDAALVDDLKKFVDIGFDIKELYSVTDTGDYYETIWSTLMHERDVNVLKYLLENGIDYKKYEREFLLECVRNSAFDYLKVLVEHGADLSLLNKIDKNADNEIDIKIYHLLEEHNIDPLTIFLLYRN